MKKAHKIIKQQTKRIAELEHENAQLQARCDQLVQAYDHLLFQVKQLQRHRFGQRSEAYIDPTDPQGRLFDGMCDDCSSHDEKDQDDSNVVPIKSHQRKKNCKKSFADHLPRKEIHIKVSDEDRVCGCGCTKQPLNPARHERLHYEPLVFEVHVELREQLACPNGCSGEVVLAPKPNHILPKARFTESLLAHIIVSTLIDRQP